MARFAGVDIPGKKHIVIALTYIHGIGPKTAEKICAQANIAPTLQVSSMTTADENKIRAILEKEYKLEGELRSEVAQNIKRLKDIACYRGLRHRKGLPTRGQRTHTNARAWKGPRASIGGVKKSGPSQSAKA